MAKSSIEITFNEVFVATNAISFTYQKGAETPQNIIETWVSTFRQNPNEVTTGGINDVLTTTINYLDAVSLDYGSLFTFQLTSDNRILITAKDDNVVFSNFTVTDGDATELINNVTYTPVFEITDISYSEATTNNKCDYVKVDVTASESVSNVTGAVTLTPNSTTFSFEYLRNSTAVINVSNGTSNINVSIPTIDKLSTPEVNVINTPNGGNISITAMGYETFEYSIDNTNWKTDNTFTSLVVGSYTAYVRDSLGCVKSQAFYVPEFTPLIEEIEPITYIDEENPILFIENKDIDGVINLKNLRNSLSCDQAKHSAEINNTYKHLREVNDIESIQILNTYENVTAYLIGENFRQDLNVNIVEKLTSITEDINCTLFSKDNKAAIYFNELPNWSSKINLPVFVAELNTYAYLESVYFDEIKGKDVVLLTVSYSGSEVNTSSQVVYNKMPFDIYELKFDYKYFNNEDIRLVVEFEDANFEDKCFISELINVKKEQKDTVEVRYKGSENGSIMYASTGIWFQTRLEYLPPEPISELDNDNENTDTDVTPISTGRHEKWKFKFPYQSLRAGLQLEQIFGVDTIEIDRESYRVAKRDSAKRLGFSGMSDFEVELYRINYGYNEKPVDFINKYVSHKLLYTENGLLVDAEGKSIIVE